MLRSRLLTAVAAPVLAVIAAAAQAAEQTFRGGRPGNRVSPCAAGRVPRSQAGDSRYRSS
jgi:hypothetical protein